MSKFSRRLFLQRASLGLAAAGGAAVLMRPDGASAHPGAAGGRSPLPSADKAVTSIAAGEPFVVYVRDPAAGEISLFMGTREIRVRDTEIVGRLIQARL